MGLIPGVGWAGKVGSIASKIAGGHAKAKHLGEFAHLGIKNQSQYASHIGGVIKNPSATRSLTNGRTAYLDKKSGTVVIHNPKAADGGTAFIPPDPVNYFYNILK